MAADGAALHRRALSPGRAGHRRRRAANITTQHLAELKRQYPRTAASRRSSRRSARRSKASMTTSSSKRGSTTGAQAESGSNIARRHSNEPPGERSSATSRSGLARLAGGGDRWRARRGSDRLVPQYGREKIIASTEEATGGKVEIGLLRFRCLASARRRRRTS